MRELQRSVWLAAGALALGAGALLAVGAGTAHADAGASASDGARSVGAAARSSARESGQRRSAASVSAAAPERNADAARSTVTATQRTSVVGAAPTPAPCLQSRTCGTATFGFTGGSQTWTVPAGVQSAYVLLEGGAGGGGGETTGSRGVPTTIGASLSLSGDSLPAPVSELQIVVGGQGGNSGAGGFNGGGPGGSGSLYGNSGAGGGGATTIFVVAGSTPVPVPVLVAGGGGGAGGYVVSGAVPGTGGTGGVAAQPSPTGVWPGGDGTAATGDNPGAGGAGGTQSNGIGAGGGNAETLSGNAGGGGGGGGWFGGSGGQPGQAGLNPFSTAGAGGGGGGGSSYADPSLTSSLNWGGDSLSRYGDGAAQIKWVDIVTTALIPLRAGRPREQQLDAVYGGDQTSVVWQVSDGALPAGMTLSSLGKFSGTPTKAGTYSFLATALHSGDSENPIASSVITYSGTVCTPRCGRGGRT